MHRQRHQRVGLESTITDSIPLCRVGDIPDGGAIAVSTFLAGDPLDLIVLREGDRAVAYCNECPHAGSRLDWAPGRFLVKDGRIVCAVHGATFATATGARIAGPCSNGLVAVPLRLDGDRVFVAGPPLSRAGTAGSR
ncbi:MAG: Rieske 2Fe-2S domain-containing protein [Dokdonella sp.]